MNNLQIEAFILCYNEEKMIKHTLNHYSQFCTKITLLDNYSTDNSIRIFMDHAKEDNKKINFEVRQFDTNKQIRDDAYMYLKNNCWKNSQADFVIVGDMDEYLYHPNIIQILQKAKINRVAIVPTEGYNMYSKTFPENYSSLLTQQVKEGVRAFNFDKNIIFSPKFVEEMLFSPGAHSCNPIYKKGYIKVNFPEKFKLLHYKYLGEKYLTEKHENYANRLSQFNKDNQFGAEYLQGGKKVKELFDILRKTKMLQVLQ